MIPAEELRLLKQRIERLEDMVNNINRLFLEMHKVKK